MYRHLKCYDTSRALCLPWICWIELVFLFCYPVPKIIINNNKGKQMFLQYPLPLICQHYKLCKTKQKTLAKDDSLL